LEQMHKFFEFDPAGEGLSSENLDARIVAAVEYINTKVIPKGGVPRTPPEQVLSRGPASVRLNRLAREGIDIRKGRVMDLGAGLGTFSKEAVSRGANLVAIEPGPGLREIVRERIRRAGSGVTIAAVGERLPFQDNTFDLVISIQVLEHVKDPDAVLREAYRVLKPGGWLYLTAENYLSFREAHYGIAWLPLLPKPVGALYLRLRRRPTEFLYTSITYTTLPWVQRMLRQCGFVSKRDRTIRSFCQSPSSIKTPWKRALILAARRLVSTERLVRALAWLNQTAHLCTPSISVLAQKLPGGQMSMPPLS
jgi:ubiquinone/menaquinone biosynthesis C-methylase UbiE